MAAKKFVPAALLFLCTITTGNAQSQSLEAAYEKRQQEQAWRNSCSHWEQAQWEEVFGSGKDARIKVFPDGRLFTSSRDRMGDGCSGDWGVIAAAIVGRMGSHTKWYPDGSGMRSTVKVEKEGLVAYSVSCSKRKCRIDRVRRTVIGRKIGEAKSRGIDLSPQLPFRPVLLLLPWPCRRPVATVVLSGMVKGKINGKRLSNSH